MSSKAMTAEPHLLPSPPPSPTPSQTSTERGGDAPNHINEADLTPVPSTIDKGKGRMVDDLVDSPQSDQDDSDEYPPDEMETKRIEEVSGAICDFAPRRSPVLFSLQCTNKSNFCRLFVNGNRRNENEGG